MQSAPGQRLRQLILKKGYKIKEFAPLIGERPDEMSRIFKTAYIDMEILRKSAQKLGVPVSDITGEPENTSRQPDTSMPVLPDVSYPLIVAERDYLRDELSKALDTIGLLAATIQNLTLKK